MTTRKASPRIDLAPQGSAHSPGVRASLQEALVDLVELQLQIAQLSWNGTGEDWSELRPCLVEAGSRIAALACGLAERMLAVGAGVQVGSEVVAARTSLEACPRGPIGPALGREVAETRLVAAAACLRRQHGSIGGHDAASAGLLMLMARELEAMAWRLGQPRWVWHGGGAHGC